MAAELVILGLGPGRWEDVTLEAQSLLAAAAEMGQPVYFRTLRHPTVETMRTSQPGLEARSFDVLYETSESWDTLYSEIAQRVCAVAASSAQPVIYAVPGHP